jgi:hypothetical protein
MMFTIPCYGHDLPFHDCSRYDYNWTLPGPTDAVPSSLLPGGENGVDLPSHGQPLAFILDLAL